MCARARVCIKTQKFIKYIEAGKNKPAVSIVAAD